MQPDWKIVHLPEMSGQGTLTHVEEGHHIPFKMKRVFWLTRIPKDGSRGKHAHKFVSQMVVAVFGSLSVLVDDGEKKEEFHLNSPSTGLLISPMVWIELFDFLPVTVCLVLSSDYYDEREYIRDYGEFKAIRNRQKDERGTLSGPG